MLQDVRNGSHYGQMTVSNTVLLLLEFERSREGTSSCFLGKREEQFMRMS